MMNVDWWTWKCARCGFTAKDAFTINPQQAVAEAIVRVHIESHEKSDSTEKPDRERGQFTGTTRIEP